MRPVSKKVYLPLQIRFLHSRDGPQSHFIRTQVMSHLIDTLNLNRKEDITKELKPGQIKRNSGDFTENC